MVNSRDKGARLEREAAHALRSELGLQARRSSRNGVEGASDLDVPGLHVEVKGRAAIAAVRFLDQAQMAAEPGTVPVVLMRENSGRWILMLALTDVEPFLERLPQA